MIASSYDARDDDVVSDGVGSVVADTVD